MSVTSRQTSPTCFSPRGAETLTLLAGEEFDDAALTELARRIGMAHPEVEIETHRGEQPLYPVIMSAE